MGITRTVAEWTSKLSRMRLRKSNARSTKDLRPRDAGRGEHRSFDQALSFDRFVLTRRIFTSPMTCKNQTLAETSHFQGSQFAVCTLPANRSANLTERDICGADRR